ncbi:hypothetical protein ACFVSQ_09210 [Streptomyces niveus]|uniref:hypothetical protein n=1 Tax=Streptomyces niveus TaxID=193462 RepID=UPI0036E48447
MSADESGQSWVSLLDRVTDLVSLAVVLDTAPLSAEVQIAVLRQFADDTEAAAKIARSLVAQAEAGDPWRRKRR